jgi:prefoldin subunit 5
MSGAQVQAEKFSKSMEMLQGSIKNVGDTVAAIFNKKPSEIFSIESLQAQANALNDLSDSLRQASQDFSGLLDAQNGWDRAKMNLQEFVDRTSKTVPIVGKLLNKITSFTFGKGARTEAASNLAETLIQTVNLATEGSAKNQIQSKLSEVIGFDISSVNIDELKSKFAELDPKILAAKFAESSAVIDNFSRSTNNTASSLTAFKDSIGETVKQFDNLVTSLAPTDLLGRLGSSLLDTSGKLTNALKDPKTSILALKEVVNSTKLMSLLPPELSSRLIEVKDKVNDLTEKIGETQKKIKDAEEAKKKAVEAKI